MGTDKEHGESEGGMHTSGLSPSSRVDQKFGGIRSLEFEM
jgi:hypothetical protein